MKTCKFDLVDIDILCFDEDLNIGQKIRSTEKIVRILTLTSTGCPYMVEPHQIQGLDWIHIFPVVQWLVKKVIETRQELGNVVRQCSLSQFDNVYGDNTKDQIEPLKYTISKRKYKKANKGQNEGPLESKVDMTLLEYGNIIIFIFFVCFHMFLCFDVFCYCC